MAASDPFPLGVRYDEAGRVIDVRHSGPSPDCFYYDGCHCPDVVPGARERFSDDIGVGDFIRVDGRWREVVRAEEPWADCDDHTRDLYLDGDDPTVYTGTYDWIPSRNEEAKP